MSNMKTEHSDSQDNKKLYEKARDCALKYLSYKNRTEKEVWDRLKKEDFSDEIIEATIELLKKYNYVNDERFAESFALSKSGNNLDGSYKIIRQLRQKGISIDNLDKLEINEAENAAKLIRKKCKNIEEMNMKEKQRIFMFLARKGYSLTVIYDAFKIIDNAIDVEWE